MLVNKLRFRLERHRSTERTCRSPAKTFSVLEDQAPSPQNICGEDGSGQTAPSEAGDSTLKIQKPSSSPIDTRVTRLRQALLLLRLVLRRLESMTPQANRVRWTSLAPEW